MDAKSENDKVKPGLKTVIGIAKYILAISLVAMVIANADREKILHHLAMVRPQYLILCFVFLNITQIISVFRMRVYLKANGLNLAFYPALKLYYAGMFFNNVLPGGIGGDGYKILVLKRKHGLSAITGTRIQVSERANGLMVLILMLAPLLYITEYYSRFPSSIFIAFGFAVSALAVYIVASRILLKERPCVSLSASKYSFLVQTFSILAALTLLYGMHAPGFTADYLFLFIIASILSAVLPVTVGGLGVREATFFYSASLGADYLIPEFGVAFCLVYYVLYLLSSFIGLLCLKNQRSSDNQH